MSLLQLKKDYEQFMLDNYTETPIHWSGTKWDISTQDEWIYFEYVGRQIGDCGLDDSEYNHEGILDITIVAKTRFRVMDIADVILNLFKNAKVGNTIARNVTIISTNTIEEIDASCMDLTIDISSI